MERFGDRIVPGGVGLQPEGCRNDLSDRQPLFNDDGGGPVHPADDDLMRHDIAGDRSSRGPPGMWQPDRCAARSLHSPASGALNSLQLVSLIRSRAMGVRFNSI